jgi:hypothetical protein
MRKAVVAVWIACVGGALAVGCGTKAGSAPMQDGGTDATTDSGADGNCGCAAGDVNPHYCEWETCYDSPCPPCESCTGPGDVIDAKAGECLTAGEAKCASAGGNCWGGNPNTLACAIGMIQDTKIDCVPVGEDPEICCVLPPDGGADAAAESATSGCEGSTCDAATE